MDGDRAQPVRDDSAWPREADSASLLIGGVALLVGILVVVNHDQPVGAALFLLLALLLGSSLIVIAGRRWLSGHALPAPLGLAGLVLLIGGSVVVNLVVGSGGFPIVASGIVAGMLLANVWAVNAARANRPPNPHEREPALEHRPSAPDEPEPAPEPATHAGVSGKDYLSFVLEARGGLVLIGDRDHRDSPVWDEGRRRPARYRTAGRYWWALGHRGWVRYGLRSASGRCPRAERIKSSPDDWTYRAGSSKPATSSSTTLRSWTSHRLGRHSSGSSSTRASHPPGSPSLWLPNNVGGLSLRS
ncbi:hypothetical protein [Micromonospora globispora]|uniref:hypothetical protein n=1 Tax=Micromonospora globispora TaxID=1450148 RepID=UPI000F5123F1|nr:hypothetical protein [Micromonospora globispora]